MPNHGILFHCDVLYLIPVSLLWGRFAIEAWLKRRTYYGITDRHVLILHVGWKRETQFCYLDSIPEISREGQDARTLWLGAKLPAFGGSGNKLAVGAASASPMVSRR